jgi:hypothetical protein
VKAVRRGKPAPETGAIFTINKEGKLQTTSSYLEEQSGYTKMDYLKDAFTDWKIMQNDTNK